MSSLKQLKHRALKQGKVRREYEALAQEFELIHKLLSLRSKAGLTQAQLAARMGTQKSNISRLERGKSNPSLKTLSNYAKACGYEVSALLNQPALPSTHPQAGATPDVRTVRNLLHYTQEEFAMALGESTHTLQHWEQGHCQPEGAAKSLLIVAAHSPEVVRSALQEAKNPNP